MFYIEGYFHDSSKYATCFRFRGFCAMKNGTRAFFDLQKFTCVEYLEITLARAAPAFNSLSSINY